MVWVTSGTTSEHEGGIANHTRDSNSVCFRGLENHTKEASQRRNEIKLRSRRAVMDGQLFLSLQQSSEDAAMVSDRLRKGSSKSRKMSKKMNKKGRRLQDEIATAAAHAAQQQLARRYSSTVQASVQAAHLRGMQDEVEAKRIRLQDYNGNGGTMSSYFS